MFWKFIVHITTHLLFSQLKIVQSFYFFDGQLLLRLNLLTHTSSLALYFHLLLFFLSNFLFIILLVFFKAFFTFCFISLIPSRNSSTVGTFSFVPLTSLPVFGYLLRLTKKRDYSILEQLQLLYANSASSSHFVQSFCL